MAGHDAVVYGFGSIRIDTSRRTLERDGEDVPIPPRVFDALLLLIQRRGDVVSMAATRNTFRQFQNRAIALLAKSRKPASSGRVSRLRLRRPCRLRILQSRSCRAV